MEISSTIRKRALHFRCREGSGNRATTSSTSNSESTARTTSGTSPSQEWSVTPPRRLAATPFVTQTPILGSRTSRKGTTFLSIVVLPDPAMPITNALSPLFSMETMRKACGSIGRR